MAGTPLDVTDPYIPAGLREFTFVPGTPGIANPASPTRTELEAGTNLTNSIVAADGWRLESQFVDDVSLKSRVVGKIAGLIDPGTSTLTFKASSASTDIREVLVQDAAGWMVVFPEGDGPKNSGPGTKMDVWPVTVGSEGMDGDIDARAQRVVSFSTGVPSTNVTIPTSP